MQRLWIRETLYVLFVPTQIHTWSKAQNQYYLFMLSHSVDRKINLIIYEDTCYFDCFVCTDGLTHTHSYNKINCEKRYEQTNNKNKTVRIYALHVVNYQASVSHCVARFVSWVREPADLGFRISGSVAGK